MRTQPGRAGGITEEAGHQPGTFVDGLERRVAAQCADDVAWPALAVDDRDAAEARGLNRRDAEMLEPLGELVGVHAESGGMDQNG